MSSESLDFANTKSEFEASNCPKRGKKKKKMYKLSLHLVCCIVSMLLVSNLIIAVVGYGLFTRSFTVEYTDLAFRVAETAKKYVDGNKIDWYLAEGEGSEEYQSVWGHLNDLCQSQGVSIIYVIDMDNSDYGSFTSVFNVVNDESGYTAWEVGYRQEVTDEWTAQMYKSIWEEDLERGSISKTTNLRGTLPRVTTYVPIHDFEGNVTAILCVQRLMGELDAARDDYLSLIVSATAIFSFVLAVSVSFFMGRRFADPIEKVSKEAKRFANQENKSYVGELEGISDIAEIAHLCDAIGKMERDVVAYIDDITVATADKERIATELAVATAIQDGVLPSLPMVVDGAVVHGLLSPARKVSGDFYDVFEIDENRLGIVIADVSGKGIPAALFMMLSKVLAKSYVVSGATPAEALSRVNIDLCKGNRLDMFVTMWFGVMDLSSGKIVAVNAGHEYPAIKRSDGRFELVKDKHSFVLGGLEGVPYKEYELFLDDGDILFVYTDGVTEAVNSQNEQFGTSRMIEALNAEGRDSLESMIEGVATALNEFVGDAPRFDDITMLALERRVK